jgi:putrescine transport system substrate-binding protein
MDPGNDFLVNWLWGFTTVGINVDKVKAALGSTPMPANVWDLVFKPEYISKLKGCGVSFLDSATEVVPAALHYLGKPPVQQGGRPTTPPRRRCSSSAPARHAVQFVGLHQRHGQRLALRGAGLVGDINIARQRAIDGKTGQNIQALIPKNGGLLFFDVMAIPADATPGQRAQVHQLHAAPRGACRA